MKLELKHIAPYLPYGLKFIYSNTEYTLLSSNLSCFEYQFSKPILRPLSDLTKEIEHNGEKFVPIEKMGLTKFYPYPKQDIEDLQRWPILCEYCRVEFLFMWHFDVFGLIEQGLAVNYNEISK